MSAKFKQCKQCGVSRPLDKFRQYYGGRLGTYNTCKVCETINSRAKYLNRKGDACSEEELQELSKINALSEAQRAVGLCPPRASQKVMTPVSDLDEMIKTYQDQASLIPDTVSLDSVPQELLKWLSEELTALPEYYQEVVYEKLRKTYRPEVRIDPATLLPEHDDTYKGVLEKVLERFDAYEDSYEYRV